MRNELLTLLLLFCLTNIFAQPETEHYKTVADKFELNYNNNDFDSIFNMFADVMKNAAQQNKGVFNTTKKSGGKYS